MTDLIQFLTWLSVSGGAVIAAAWIWNQIDWFKLQSQKAENWIMLGTALALALLSKAALLYIPPDVLAQIQPWFETIAGIVAVFLTGRAANAMLYYHGVSMSRRPEIK